MTRRVSVGTSLPAALRGGEFVKVLAVLAACSALLLFAETARAADLTVTSDADSGPGSLRAVLDQANRNGEADTIKFDLPEGQRTIALRRELLASAPQDTVVNGEDNEITLSGSDEVRVLRVEDSGGRLTLRNLTVANGNSGADAGGILNDGALRLDGSIVSGNRANNEGGGIYNKGTMTLSRSTVSGNRASFGGGIYNSRVLTLTGSTVSGNRASFGSGIYNSSYLTYLTIIGSTLSGNSAAKQGGGIYNRAGTMTLTGSTVSGNRASNEGGGIYSYRDPQSSSDATFRSTIISDNQEGGNCAGSKAITDGGYNLDSGASCGFNRFTSQSNTNPKLEPFANYGGLTKTYAIEKDSPAVDQGNSFGQTTDQRGADRPVDFPRIANANSGDGSDIGAFELQASPPPAGDGPGDGPGNSPEPSIECTIKGTSSGEIIRGTPGRDVICGLGGKDIIYGLGGNDLLRGGAGNDLLDGGTGDDTLRGEEGNDIVKGQEGNDTLYGGPQKDVLVGGEGKDRLFGESGDIKRP